MKAIYKGKKDNVGGVQFIPGWEYDLQVVEVKSDCIWLMIKGRHIPYTLKGLLKTWQAV